MKLAKDLLTEDGVIFISINDCERDNIKKCCDDIYGECNFISSMIWQQRKGGGNDSKYVAADHEYVLIYAKNIETLPDKWRIPQDTEYLKRYKEIDSNGNRYYWDTLVRNGLQSPIVITVTAPDGKDIIAETKGTMESLQLKPIEQAKISCAKKRFNEISSSKVRYHDVDSYQSLLAIMSKI